jgi:hypothetical protein
MHGAHETQGQCSAPILAAKYIPTRAGVLYIKCDLLQQKRVKAGTQAFTPFGLCPQQGGKGGVRVVQLGV